MTYNQISRYLCLRARFVALLKPFSLRWFSERMTSVSTVKRYSARFSPSFALHWKFFVWEKSLDWRGEKLTNDLREGDD
jgi:hypothetical protein